MFKRLVFFFILLISFGLVGCDEEQPPKVDEVKESKPQRKLKTITLAMNEV